TRYNQPFTMYKFRTMTVESGRSGEEITGRADPRITRLGRLLRNSRLDELPQLWNVLRGEMSLVGPRPEAERYVECYDDAARATLLMPAGITSPASLFFADEAELLDTDQNERVYIELLMPRKAALNLEYLRDFSLALDCRVLFRTMRRMFLDSG
ncbi:MAG: sugar transferase, partial [Oscillospiraceae bacterium]